MTESLFAGIVGYGFPGPGPHPCLSSRLEVTVGDRRRSRVVGHGRRGSGGAARSGVAVVHAAAGARAVAGTAHASQSGVAGDLASADGECAIGVVENAAAKGVAAGRRAASGASLRNIPANVLPETLVVPSL